MPDVDGDENESAVKDGVSDADWSMPLLAVHGASFVVVIELAIGIREKKRKQ